MNKKLLASLALVLVSLPALAVQTATTPAGDKNVEMLAADLHALARIADVAKDLGDVRQTMLAIIDSDLDTLRGPRGDGTYQYASLQREEGGRVSDEKTVEYVSTEKELRNVTVTAANAYRVEVIAPRKKGTFSANNRVYIRNILVDATGFDGKTTHAEIPVNAWVNPGDTNSTALPDISKSAKVTAELGVETGAKAAVAQVAVLQAKLVDDPTGPYYPATQKLAAIRALTAAKDMNRGAIKTANDEALLSLPGELEKRAADQAAAAQARLTAAQQGITSGSINLGDATPDVTRELDEIARLLAGTAADQEQGRTRLAALIAKLKPAQMP
jgi:hypothetical protein